MGALLPCGAERRSRYLSKHILQSFLTTQTLGTTMKAKCCTDTMQMIHPTMSPWAKWSP